MGVKYNKSRGIFEIRHYEDLSNKEIVDGVNNIDTVDKKLIELKSKLKKYKLQLKKAEAEVEDLENYQDVIGRVTHIYNGVPIMQSINPPSDDDVNGRFSFSSIGSYSDRKSLYGWVNVNSSRSEIENGDIWCFRLSDGRDKEETFLAQQYKGVESSNGFTLDFIKMIAYEFVVNGKPISEFYRNLTPWFKIHDRDKAIKDLLDS